MSDSALLEGMAFLVGPVLEDLFKTAHSVCPSTNAFLVPIMNFLAKIFAV